MPNILKSTIILVAAIMLTGCWSIPFPSGDTPDNYIKSKNTIKSLTGTTVDEIETKMGEPTWVVVGASKTYYVYEWWSDEADIMMVGYLPIPWIFTEDANEAHCILLEFSSDWRLLDHKVDTESSSFHSWAPVNCLDVFGFATKKYGSGEEIWIMREEYSIMSLDEIKEHVKMQSLDSIDHTGDTNAKTQYQLFLVAKSKENK